MKNSNFKKIMSLVLFAALVLTAIFTLSSCKEHVCEFETETVNATCTEDGYVKKSCSCGKTDFQVLRATGHTLKVKSEIPATCTEGGKIVKACACGYEEIETTNKTGHKYEVTTQVDATCTEDGTVVKTCSCGDTVTETVKATGHKLQVTTDVAATCTEEGKIVKSCACGYEEVGVRKPTGHTIVNHEGKAASCTENGYAAYETCKNCDYTTYEEIPAAGHKSGEMVQENVKPFSCTEDGSVDEVVYCENCGEELSRETKPVIAPGHNWVGVDAKAATCVPGWYAHEECSFCNDKKGYTEIPAMYDHIMSEHPIEIEGTRVLPTCTEDGYYLEAYMCTHDCGYRFTEPTKRTLDALGHDIVKHDGQDPDCVNEGWKAYETCARCDEYNTYEAIPALGHTNLDPVEENRFAPDCVNEGGYDMVVYCKVCGEEVSREHFVVDALGHTPLEKVEENRFAPDCVNEGGYDEVVYCKVCGEELERVHFTVPANGHTYVEHEAKAHTCTEIGWDAYKTCEVCDYNEYVEIPAHGHNEVELPIENFVEPTCAKEGSYDRVFVCTICEVELKRESWTVPAVAHNNLGVVDAKAPTCTEGGWEAYTCCSKCGYTDNKVELEALGHDIKNHEAKAPTCTEIGWDAYETCSRCDHSTYEEKAALGHNVVTLNAVAPDCENDGLTAGQYCTRCDDLTVEQKVVSKLGHDRDANGLCGNCGDKISLGLDFTPVNGGYEFTGTGDCNDKTVIIPSEVNGVPVVSVADNAFKYSGVESVVIPESVEVIGREAFFSCPNLKSVVIEGTTTIEARAFFGCAKLESVTIGAEVKSIGTDAFAYCYKLTTVYYHGTAADWAKISIASGNSQLTGAKKYYI